MAERSLSMREAPGSIPGLSTNTTLQVGGLYSSVGQSARLVSARSGVRTSLEARFLFRFVCATLVQKYFCAAQSKMVQNSISSSLWLGPHCCMAGLVVDRTRDL